MSGSRVIMRSAISPHASAVIRAAQDAQHVVLRRATARRLEDLEDHLAREHVERAREVEHRLLLECIEGLAFLDFACRGSYLG